MGQGLQRDFTWFPLGVGGSTWFWSHKTPFERRAFRRIAWTFWVYGLVAFRISPATIWSKDLLRACFLSRSTWKEKPTEIALPMPQKHLLYSRNPTPTEMKVTEYFIECLGFQQHLRGGSKVPLKVENHLSFQSQKSAIQTSANQDFKECRDIERKKPPKLNDSSFVGLSFWAKYIKILDQPESKPSLYYIYIWVFPKIMVPPNHPWINKLFHYFHHPFWGFSPYFWKHPYIYTPFPDVRSSIHPGAFFLTCDSSAKRSTASAARLTFLAPENDGKRKTVWSWETSHLWCLLIFIDFYVWCLLIFHQNFLLCSLSKHHFHNLFILFLSISSRCVKSKQAVNQQISED